jgi:hypothetical protein
MAELQADPFTPSDCQSPVAPAKQTIAEGTRLLAESVFALLQHAADNFPSWPQMKKIFNYGANKEMNFYF